MQKTPLIKSFIGMLIIFLLFDTLAVFNILKNFSNLFKTTLTANPTINIILALGIIIGFVLSIILLIKLFKMSVDILLWIHITFGFGILNLILYFILPGLTPAGKIPLILYPLGEFFARIMAQYKLSWAVGFYIIVLASLWFGISRHVKKQATS